MHISLDLIMVIPVSESGLSGFMSAKFGDFSPFTLNRGSMLSRPWSLPKSLVNEICSKRDDDTGSGTSLFQPF